MNSVGQWIHQHNALLFACFVLGACFVAIGFFRRRSALLWAAWCVVAQLCIGGAYVARTPAASLSEHAATTDSSDPSRHLAYEELVVTSVEDIRSVLGRGGKPTLVEIYSDYGFS